ncbi:hypothetical protein AB1K42_24220 [Roseibium algicola]|uniref:hypothetical protein n=1 Tax=Roseibium algicola TaxID=2857014 RepID=UPI0034596E19
MQIDFDVLATIVDHVALTATAASLQPTEATMQQSSSSKIRIPLDHPETDALDLRIRDLILSGCLSEGEHGRLIKSSIELRRVDRSLARKLLGLPLPETDIRPMYPDENQLTFSIYHGVDQRLVEAGWVYRLRDYVERVEAKYVRRQAVGPEDDI